MKLPCTRIKNFHIAIGRFTEATRLRRYRYDDTGRLIEAAYSESLLSAKHF